MSELNKHEHFSEYDSMATEELQEILCKHADGELETEPDTDELYYIMEVLSERRSQANPQAFQSDEEALADFRKQHMPNENKGKETKPIRLPNRLLRIAAVVAIAVFVAAMGMTVTAQAFRVDIWSKFASWTKEIFRFTDTPQETDPQPPEKVYNAELDSLRDALEQNGVTEALVPDWMPEGYKNIDLKVTSSPRVLNLNAIYELNDERLIIKIRRTIGVQATQVEKNDDLLEVYPANGVDYYIFSNTETLQAAWSIGEFECIITGKLILEEMKAMIDSI